MRKEAEAWLRISAEDLQSAEVLSDRKLFRPACYHAQHSVEKSLKALLVDRNIEIPRTHNLLDLNNAVKNLGYAVALLDEDAIFLSSIYRARYPSDAGLLPLGEPIEQDAARALKIAREMAAWMRKQIGGFRTTS
jgi:HEPN domain-containing protein